MTNTNRIFSTIKAGGTAFGTWAQMGSSEFCEIAAKTGLEFVIVDMEHGSFGIETAVNMVRAIEVGGATAMIRVHDAAPSTILKALDSGAPAILVPNVDSREMAEQIVESTRFAPKGRRGACPCTRANGHGVVPWGRFTDWCDHNILVAVLIETPEGFENFDEIVGVEGIDIVAFGPFDLSQAMGLNGDWKHPSVLKRQEELVKKTLDRGIQVMPSTFDSDPEGLAAQVAHWQSLGARIFAVSGDRFMLSSGYGAIVHRLSGMQGAKAAAE
ncbi:HpcH/HpaI aldolase family protein [Brucella pseudogrignonensis]|uniref:HpcH/HpaI aldolase family protein n=1 Tax=Brucella pseudogrignonensis TaxID=419475 RepID=UPI003ED170E9